MKSFSNFYDSSWLQTYKNTDQIWLADSLNFEKVATLSTHDFSFISFLYNPSFINQHLLLDYNTKLSYLDIFLINTKFLYITDFTLYNSFIYDLTSSFNVNFLFTLSFFSSAYQNNLNLTLFLSPELILAFNDNFYYYYFSTMVDPQVIVFFDSYVNNLNYYYGNGVLSFFLFFFYVWLLIYMFSISLVLKWTLGYYNYFVRFYYFFYSLSKENRTQFEAVVQTAIFFIFYWSMAIMSFDDDKEEVIEFLDTSFFLFFTFTIFYFIYKHSIHYFSFLEASISSESRTLSYLPQFKNDFLGLCSMFLRFYSLLIRLNIYDTLDDCLDFYYVLLGDFDDDEYLGELFFSIHGTIFFTMDNQGDRSFLLEDENDFSNDFFYSYFVIWGKLFFFFFFFFCIFGSFFSSFLFFLSPIFWNLRI